MCGIVEADETRLRRMMTECLKEYNYLWTFVAGDDPDEQDLTEGFLSWVKIYLAEKQYGTLAIVRECPTKSEIREVASSK